MMRDLIQAEGEISFLQLLMDETICAGSVRIPKDLIKKAGGVNPGLKAGRKYELLLRIAQTEPISFVERQQENKISAEDYVVLEEDSEEIKRENGWKTDCYVAAKYSGQLKESGYFDVVIEAILGEAMKRGRSQETIEYLESMLSRKDTFFRIDDMTKPILIYKGDDICHNVLTVFAEQFGEALERAGKRVIYFDMSKEALGNVTRYMYQRFCAIIGVQSYMFTIKMEDENHYLHEYIYGPKYNFIFDHPIWLKNHLMHRLKHFHVLTHDANYVAFVERHFCQDAVLFPPGGMELQMPKESERKYDLTFVGTYNDYWSQVPVIHEMERKKRFFANHLLRVMRQNTELTSEEAFDRVVTERELSLSEEEYLELFYEMRRVFYCVTHYYRDRVLRAILKGGVKVDVFGDDWESCRLQGYPNLICHPDITVEKSLEVWSQSKLSLNIMSWHKAGFTERMANIMLAGAVLVTDNTAYLDGKYDAKDMLIFRLQERDRLPQQIKGLLADSVLRERIAKSGREKAKKAHTWDARAREFLQILQERENL